MKAPRSVGVQFIVIAALYLMVTLVMGLVMGITDDHSLLTVHSHLGLLGWTTMALTGIVYLVLPSCERSVLARVHFWLHNLGLPLMAGALVVQTLSGDPRTQPAIGVGSFLVLLALLVFTINLVRNGRIRGAAPPTA